MTSLDTNSRGVKANAQAASPLKVAHVVENIDDSYGGPARSLPNLAAGQRSLGLNVQLLSNTWRPNERNDVVEREQLDSQCFRIVGPQKISWSPGLASRIEYLCKSPGTVIHLHTLWNAVGFVASSTAIRTGARLVISPRGALFPWSLHQGRIRKQLAWRLFVRRVLDAANFVHATDAAEADAIRALGVKAPMVVIPNGVEPVADSELEPARRSRMSRSTHASGRRFLLLSRLHKKKGIDILIRSWARSVARTAGGRLRIVGPGQDAGYLGELKRLVEMCGVADSVYIHGMVTGRDREREFCDADVFVLPSHTENFGIAIAEALAHGLPVITTTGTPWRAIAERRAGWWIDLSEESLVAALDDAAGQPYAVLHGMGDQAISLSREYSWDLQAERMVDAYRAYS